MTGGLAFIVAEKAKALIVPSQAVRAGRVSGVEDNPLQKREVRVGIKSVERTEIVPGLPAGERVAITPIPDHRDSHDVGPGFAHPNIAAGLNNPPAIQDSFNGF